MSVMAHEAPPSGVPLTHVSVPSPEITGIAKAWPYTPNNNKNSAETLVMNFILFP
jgi:hypothetical protein